MKRNIVAALAYNVYALVFVLAFWAATPILFHGTALSRLENQGVPFNFEDWGFDDHYIWRLAAAVISTILSAIICGAIARENGRTVALFANIPSVIGWIAYVWMFFFLNDTLDMKGDAKLEGVMTAYGVVSIMAIPVTCWLATKGGEIGGRLQTALSDQDKTLGIEDWHWAWIWFPLNWYGYHIIVTIVAVVIMQLNLWTDVSLFASLVSLLGFAIVAAWIAPLVLTYQTLAGSLFHDRSPMQRGGIIGAILIGGYFLATAITYGLGPILKRFGLF